MMFSQDDRPIAVHTVLPKDTLLLTGFAGTEAVSEAFRFRLAMLSTDHAIDAAKLIGTPARVRVRVKPARVGVPAVDRWFHGYIARFSAGRVAAALGKGAGAATDGLRSYTADLVPGLWFLSQVVVNRVHSGASTLDLAQKLLEELGDLNITKLSQGIEDRFVSANNLSKTDDIECFHMQHNESTLDFLSRKLEDEGIHYHFIHSDSDHTLVLGDTNGVFSRGLLDSTPLSYDPSDWGYLTQWEERAEFTAKNWGSSDYDPRNSQSYPSSKEPLLPGNAFPSSAPSDGTLSQLTTYEWPGGYYASSDAKSFITKRRAQQRDGAVRRAFGAGTCAALAAGTQFLPKTGAGAATAHLLLRVTHEITCDGYLSDGEYTYSNQFEALSLADPSMVYRPPRLTPKPRIHGMLTAEIVSTGSATSGVDCDRDGRVRVRFHHLSTPSGSCPVRVSQAWAGAGFGTLHMPHIGQEVLVSFLDGDPDRPVITGRVYNDQRKPPLDPKENWSKSIIQDHGANRILTEGVNNKQRVEVYSPTEASTILVGKAEYTPIPIAKAMEELAKFQKYGDAAATSKFAQWQYDRAYARRCAINNAEAEAVKFSGNNAIAINEEAKKKYNELLKNVETLKKEEANPYTQYSDYIEYFFPELVSKKAPEAKDGVLIDTSGNITMYANDIKQYTKADKSEYICGNWYTVKKGNSFDVSEGCSVSRALNAKAEFSASAKSSFTAGASLAVDGSVAVKISLAGSMETSLALKTSLALSGTFEVTGSAKMSIVLFSAEKKIKDEKVCGNATEFSGLLKAVVTKKEETIVSIKKDAVDIMNSATSLIETIATISQTTNTTIKNAVGSYIINASTLNLTGGLTKIG